jgi:tRNA(fMet)-specific endonuclease VapC
MSVEEQLSGWYSLLRRAKRRKQLARVYQELAESVQFLGGWRILSFPEPAIVRYAQLAALKLQVRKMDLRIAAITLENACTLVTRNLRDFQRVPGLVIEDWAQ